MLAVSVEVVLPGGVTEVGFKLELPQVSGFAAPAGLVVTAHVRAMAEENPPEGVTVIVVVLPEVAPWVVVMAPAALREKSAGKVTVTLTTVEDVTLPDVPVTVTW